MNNHIYILLFFLFSNILSISAQSTWPLDANHEPADGVDQLQQHPVIATFGQYYKVNDEPAFYPGIDIYAPQGAPVYAVSSGLVTAINADNVKVGRFWYQNITDIKVGSGDLITKGDLLGYVNNLNYLHFRESSSLTTEDWINPIAEGNSLGDFEDNVAPVIKNVKLVSDNTGQVFTPGQLLTGKVDIIVDVYDPATWTANQGNNSIRCGIKEIEIQFENLEGNLITNNDEPICFKLDLTNSNNQLPSNSATSSVYSENTNNKKFEYVVTSNPFSETNNFDDFWDVKQKKGTEDKTASVIEEALFPDGEYTIKVIAKDFRGNVANYKYTDENTPIDIDVSLQSLSIQYAGYKAPFWRIDENNTIKKLPVYLNRIDQPSLFPVFGVKSGVIPGGTKIYIVAEWEAGSAEAEAFYNYSEGTITLSEENEDALSFQLPNEFQFADNFPINFYLRFESGVTLKSTSPGIVNVPAGNLTGTIMYDLTRSHAEKRAYELNRYLNSKIAAIVHCRQCETNNDDDKGYKDLPISNGTNMSMIWEGKNICFIIYYTYSKDQEISAKINTIPAKEYTNNTKYWDNYLGAYFYAQDGDEQPLISTDCSQHIDELLLNAFSCEVGWQGDINYIDLLFERIAACLNATPLIEDTNVAITEFSDDPIANKSEIRNDIITRLNTVGYNETDDPTYQVTLKYPDGDEILKSPYLDAHPEEQADVRMSFTFSNGQMRYEVELGDNFIAECVEEYTERMTQLGYYISVEQVKQVQIAFKAAAEKIAYWTKRRAEEELKFATNDVKKPDEFLRFGQVFFKCAKSMMKNGTVLEGMWYNRSELYPYIPYYADLGPITCGVVDESLNVVTAAPMMTRTIAKLIGDKEERDAFAQIFTKEGVLAMAEGFVNEIDEVIIYPDKTDYYISKAITQVGVALLSRGSSSFASGLNAVNNSFKGLKKIVGLKISPYKFFAKSYFRRLKLKSKALKDFEELMFWLKDDGLKKIDNLLEEFPDEKVDNLIADLNGKLELLDKFAADPDAFNAWKVLQEAGRAGNANNISRKIEALDALKRLRSKTAKLLDHDISDTHLGNMLKKGGWGGDIPAPSYEELCDQVGELLEALPKPGSPGASNLSKFLGSEGFDNGLDYTRRHAYVQLQRLLKNDLKTIIQNADEVIFERQLTNTLSNGKVINSFSDLHIKMPDGRIIELETKAGMEFFSGVASSGSNFATQSFNSLKNITDLKDYKVILNEAIKDGLNAGIHKQQIIKAWKNFEGGELLQDPKIRSLFTDYFGQNVDNAEILESLLKKNNNWFDEIFKSDLTL